MDLKTKSLVELKALVYDQLAIIQRCQDNMKAIDAEIQTRKSEGEKKSEEGK